MTYTIHTTATAPTATTSERVITATFRLPARVAHVVIDNQPFINADSAPEAYRAIIVASLETAAKSILSDYIKGFAVGVMPTSMDTGYFSETALIDRATSSGIQWLSKEEITEQWKESATYQAWVTSPAFKSNPKMAKAVSYYSDLIGKLAGKTSTYKESDLDLMLAKLQADDLTTPLGTFIVRRVEALKAKPIAEEIDVNDLL